MPTSDNDRDADGSPDAPNTGTQDTTTDSDAFAREVEHARDLLADDVDALFAGVVRDGEVETTFSQRADDREQEALQPLALLAAHLRLVSNEAGVEPSTVAGDAATLAGQVEEVPTDADDLPDQ